MQPKYILDTDTLSLLFKGHEKVASRARTVCASMNIPLGITRVTYIEQFVGRGEAVIKAADGPELERAARAFRMTLDKIDAMDISEIDEVTVRHFAEFQRNRKYRKAGRKDMLIASIFLASGATFFVTRNTKDFELLLGSQRLQNWAD